MKRILICLLAILLLASLACKTPENPSAQTPQTNAAAPVDPGTEAVEPTPEPTSEPTPEPTPEPTRPPEPEEPAYEPLPDDLKTLSERVRGDWYADYAGLVISLALNEDGGYSATIPGSEPLSGKWETKDGAVLLDGDEQDALLVIGDVLRWDGMDLLFTREKPETYVPAEVYAEAAEGAFDGYWKSHFAAVGESVILAEAIGDDTELYIEGTKLATNGELLGLAMYEGTISDGALTVSDGGAAIELRLQQDGFLRLTLAGDTPATLYLMPMPMPGETPTEAPTP